MSSCNTTMLDRTSQKERKILFVGLGSFSSFQFYSPNALSCIPIAPTYSLILTLKA